MSSDKKDPALLHRENEQLRQEVSRLKTRETELLCQLSDLEHETNRIRSRFISKMSHEIRTPMNGIIGLAEIWQHKPIAEETKEAFFKIKLSARHLLAIVNHTLDYSKIKAGKLILAREEFILEDIVREAMLIAGEKIGDKPVTIKMRLLSDVPRQVSSDGSRLRQMLQCVLDTAVKNTAKGSIMLTVSRADTDSAQSPSGTEPEEVMLRFCITDNGSEMSSEQLALLCVEQGDPALGDEWEVEKMGLPITKQLAELMGGCFTIAAREGLGITAEITLPFGRVLPSGEDSEEKAQYHFPGARVLVCEDNAINQEVITGVLELFDISAVAAGNGAEGIGRLEQEAFDLVVMDLQMPVMDGHEATKAVRASGQPYQNIPIIALTANALEEEMAVCLREGMNGYVNKPIDLTRLYGELLKWLPEALRKKAESEAGAESSQGAAGGSETETRLSEPKEELTVQLAGLEIDLKDAVARFGGKEELYLKSLKKFAADLHSRGMREASDPAWAETAELGKYIHSLKGVAANLSMKEDYRLLREMEVTVKAGKPDMLLYRKVCAHLLAAAGGVLKILEQNLREEKPRETESGSREECMELLRQLKECLRTADARECEGLVLLLGKKDWDGIDAARLSAIGTAVESYDYARAAALMEDF